MTGCEACSALVAAGDASCATCGADLGPARHRRARPRVDIPVRRYGRVPRPPRALRTTHAKRPGRQQLALAAAVMVPVVAGALAALVLFG
ncbi:hypothetical protein [Ramlibacter sp.]|uniref:hypothetical protein n=1 Tax=Ramlibacter sp. TaxID=1917967 RepID=UPI002D32E224|nr:hypothetical protein [Ramlibacter sp.]HYD77511.1 hypothetical protein [Ramlibacter sp.]